ncbi:hypothetical protein L21SP5_01988 [Salinivirga cyanobacteriivorans]|uniref:ATP synthase I chain n=1 Tax=Salinivirga cyanobacteriivorans TaxID=1307839 RepID=A0A0S2I024_9BACT|nr:hypothetical protein [Salinivirga cyanobacteriivorans]ALO15627.1 hypothetical protein L21SP5_01988 [Salinivirga cyanobacteriivorans]
MWKTYRKFLITTLLLSLVLSFAGWAIFNFTSLVSFHPAYIYLLIAYLIFTWIIQYALYRYVQKRLAVFNRAFMGLTGLKLLVLIAAMLIMAFTVPVLFKTLLIEMLILYLLFSVVEIRDILQFMKKK